MRNSKIKLTITALFLAGTIGTFSVFAHEGEGKGMMSSEGMEGMGGMMGMMSDMSPEDQEAKAPPGLALPITDSNRGLS